MEIARREAVDDCRNTYAGLGEKPDVPSKGTFNLRIGAELHRKVALGKAV